MACSNLKSQNDTGYSTARSDPLSEVSKVSVSPSSKSPGSKASDVATDVAGSIADNMRPEVAEPDEHGLYVLMMYGPAGYLKNLWRPRDMPEHQETRFFQFEFACLDSDPDFTKDKQSVSVLSDWPNNVKPCYDVIQRERLEQVRAKVEDFVEVWAARHNVLYERNMYY